MKNLLNDIDIYFLLVYNAIVNKLQNLQEVGENGANSNDKTDESIYTNRMPTIKNSVSKKLNVWVKCFY